MHKIWPERRAYRVKYESINNSDLVCHLLPFVKVARQNFPSQSLSAPGDLSG